MGRHPPEPSRGDSQSVGFTMVCEGCQTVEYEPVLANAIREMIHRGKAWDFKWDCEGCQNNGIWAGAGRRFIKEECWISNRFAQELNIGWCPPKPSRGDS